MLSFLSTGAICYISGVYICDYFGVRHMSGILGMAGLLGCILLLLFRKHRRFIFPSTLFLCAGIIACAHATDLKNNSFYPLNEKYVSVCGYICDLPVKNGETYSYSLKTTHMEYLGTEYRAGQVIRMTSKTPFRFGTGVRAKGFLKEFSTKKNSTDFDTKRYYRSRGISYRMYASHPEECEINEKFHSLSYWTNLYKSRMADAIDKSFSEEHSAILKAVMFGNKHCFSDDFQSLLSKTGIMKFFYPAYFHIYLMSAFVSLVFGNFRKKYRDCIFCALLLIYAVQNSYSPVLVRSSLSVIAGIVMVKKLGFSHTPDLIALTLLVLCVPNPLYCFDVGIIMSVATILLLYYFKDIISGALFFIPLPSARRFLSFYIITTLGLFPLAACFFNGISVFANLLTPLYLVVVAGLLINVPAALLSQALFGTMLFFEKIVTAFCSYFEYVPYLLEKVPFSHIWIKPFGTMFIIAFYCTLFVVYRFCIGDAKKRLTICLTSICVGFWCGIGIGYVSSIGNMYITFVNVGQGDGAVINVRGGETLLIDGGGKPEYSNYDAGAKVFFPYLTDNGHFYIDKAIVSHCHSDHCLGIISAMKSLTVREVLMPDTEENNPYRIEIEEIARQKGIKLTYVKKGDVINLKSGLKLNILSPGDDELASDNENDASVVVKLEYNGFNCLFTGDIGKSVEEKLLNDVSDCDVVKMSHHGSRKSNSFEFAKATGADFAVATVGENNSYGFPTDEAVKNYRSNGTKVLRTDQCGDITVKTDKNGHYKIYTGKNSY